MKILKGQRVKLSFPLKTRCCNCILPEGKIIKWYSNKNKGIVMTRLVFVECEGTIHKVKISNIKGVVQ